MARAEREGVRRDRLAEGDGMQRIFWWGKLVEILAALEGNGIMNSFAFMSQLSLRGQGVNLAPIAPSSSECLRRFLDVPRPAVAASDGSTGLAYTRTEHR